MLHTGALWSDSEQSDDVISFIAPNVDWISPPEQNNGIYYMISLNTYGEAIELGMCVQKFSAQYVVCYVGASQAMS